MIFEDRIQENPRLFRLKDPRTNEIVDFEIQDLLPSEIVQEGTEIDAAYLNGLLTYSMGEKQVGYWIDGKPIYQKTIVSLGDTGTNVALPHNISNIGAVIKADIIATNNIGITYPAHNDVYSLYVKAVGATDVLCNINGAYIDTTWKVFVTLEYTKTTD